jgi:hypothetical protein
MKRFLTIMVMVMTAAGLVACGTQYRWHQKLTVAVETPDGVKTGSAVTRVSALWGRQPLSGNGVAFGVMGEATVVELPNGQYLFALLANQSTRSDGFLILATEYVANEAFSEQLSGGKPLVADDTRSELFEKLQAFRGSRTLPRDQYPLLVTFKDINDPTSVKLVDPDNLAATFGEGYRLQSITLEITDEDVTNGRVEKTLEWLSQENPIFIDWKQYPAGHPLRIIGKNSFIVGNQKK